MACWISIAAAWGLQTELRALGFLVNLETQMIGNRQVGRVTVTGRPVTSRDFQNAASDSERPPVAAFGRTR